MDGLRKSKCSEIDINLFLRYLNKVTEIGNILLLLLQPERTIVSISEADRVEDWNPVQIVNRLVIFENRTVAISNKVTFPLTVVLEIGCRSIDV